MLAEAKAKKGKADYDAVLSAGRSALSAGRLDDAIRSLQQAKALMPAETEPGKLLEEATSKKRKAEYDAALSAGRSALSAGRYDEAIRSLQQAKALMPAETEPGKLLTETESKKRKAAVEKLLKAAEARKRDYDRYLSQGKSALSSRRYDDAIRAFQDAERLGPFGGEAANLRGEAERKKTEEQWKKRRCEAVTILVS